MRGVVARPEAWQVRPVGYGVHLRGRALLCACGVCLRRVPLPLRVSGGVAGFTCCGIGSPAGGGGACVGAVALRGCRWCRCG